MRLYFLFVPFFTNAAATFATQTLYESKGSENGIIEVGPGNLKLIYSASEGKLTQYVNTKSLVCYWLAPSFFNLADCRFSYDKTKEHNVDVSFELLENITLIFLSLDFLICF